MTQKVRIKGVSVPKDKVMNIDVRLSQLQAELDRLHSLYEQHFAGVLKREPQKEHMIFKASFRSVTPADLKTTAAKFRFQGVQNKYTQFSVLWDKTLKQIEEGTYRRDLFMLQKKVQPKAEAPKQANTMPSAPPVSKALDSLYEKMRQMVSSEKALPQKDKFLASLQRQIDEQKKKNPDKKIEIKLQKDASGQVQVKLGFQKK